MKFKKKKKKSEFKLGNILTVFMLPNSDKPIALFTVSAFDKDDHSLNIAYIRKDHNGYDHLEEIKDEQIYKDAILVVQDIIKNINY